MYKTIAFYHITSIKTIRVCCGWCWHARLAGGANSDWLPGQRYGSQSGLLCERGMDMLRCTSCRRWQTIIVTEGDKIAFQRVIWQRRLQRTWLAGPCIWLLWSREKNFFLFLLGTPKHLFSCATLELLSLRHTFTLHFQWKAADPC